MATGELCIVYCCIYPFEDTDQRYLCSAGTRNIQVVKKSKTKKLAAGADIKQHTLRGGDAAQKSQDGPAAVTVAEKQQANDMSPAD